MRVLRWLIILWMLLIVVGTLAVFLTGMKLSACIDRGNQGLRLIHSEEEAKGLGKNEVCLRSKEVLLEVISCRQKVQDTSFIPISVVDVFSRVAEPGFVGVEEVTEVHNRGCLDYPATLIK